MQERSLWNKLRRWISYRQHDIRKWFLTRRSAKLTKELHNYKRECVAFSSACATPSLKPEHSTALYGVITPGYVHEPLPRGAALKSNPFPMEAVLKAKIEEQKQAGPRDPEANEHIKRMEEELLWLGRPVLNGVTPEDFYESAAKLVLIQPRYEKITLQNILDSINNPVL
jgi:hypothetical protein